MATFFRYLVLPIVPLFLAGCSDLPLTDTRPTPEPPALPAPVMECPPVVEVRADKMNVLYVGLDNPMSLSVDHRDPQSLKIVVSGAKSSFRGGGGRYLVKPNEPGMVNLLVLNEGGRQVAKMSFRAKRLPDPQIQLGTRLGGAIPVGEFRAQRGLMAVLNNFDFYASCRVSGFRISHVRTTGETASINIEGGAFGERGERMLRDAQVGDHFLFTDVRAKCPGDGQARRLNSLAFTLQ